MPRLSESIKKEEHIHNWVSGSKSNEKTCSEITCFKVGIFVSEAVRREEEWNNYFELMRTTPSFIEFMKAKNSNKKTRIEIAKQAQKRLDENDYLPKPSFPDPIGDSWKYIIFS